MRRTTVVGWIKVNSVELSSIMIAGDAGSLFPAANVFAVQREGANFLGNEGNLSAFPIFRSYVPMPDVTEQLELSIHHENDTVQVGVMNILGVSASSILQLGSNHHIHAISRVKHIRQLRGTGAEAAEPVISPVVPAVAVPPVPPVAPV
ncbi:spore germination protein GerPE [Paenibacillus senegalensis]|uniref:spore germination protein GerPE n=1 Tax=Paenibacillus senegalensis TaxID=1465766 RepID=UPI00031320A6|nr:spore germination protein GerPE [Paenibacillus senegalensis]